MTEQTDSTVADRVAKKILAIQQQYSDDQKPLIQVILNSEGYYMLRESCAPWYIDMDRQGRLLFMGCMVCYAPAQEEAWRVVER
jgi:hypothetical protein